MAMRWWNSGSTWEGQKKGNNPGLHESRLWPLKGCARMSLKDWALEGRGTQENCLIVKDPPPGLRTVYPNKQQVKRQKVCMDKQVAPCLTQCKKEAHRRWKQGLVTLEEYGGIIQVCREVNKEV